MSKVIEKKKQKREALLDAALSLFISQGIESTSISDIVKGADMAKGTFYLYFKDKYEIRDQLIHEMAKRLFHAAERKLSQTRLGTLEEKVIYLADCIIDQLNENKNILRFISKNLSWGIFHDMLVTGEGEDFYGKYVMMLEQSGRKFRNPELMLYMIVELINSTCHNVILRQEPVTLEELKPELYGAICDMIRRQEI